MRWARDGIDWPLRASSRFVEAAGIRWHVQQPEQADYDKTLGRTPGLLLLHGTGASSHSYRALVPLLVERFELTLVDLPGHGFSSAGGASAAGLPGMARGLSSLLNAIEFEPAIIVGHSAGAAIGAQMILERYCTPQSLISLNGAFLPWDAWPARLFGPIAKLLALNPLVPALFSWRAGHQRAVRDLIESTGSKLDGPGMALYARLMRDPDHVAGALRMMANWELAPLVAHLHEFDQLDTTLWLVVGENDQTVAPAQARRVATLVTHSRIVQLPELGHLAHEERPDLIADLILRTADAAPEIKQMRNAGSAQSEQ